MDKKHSDFNRSVFVLTREADVNSRRDASFGIRFLDTKFSGFGFGFRKITFRSLEKGLGGVARDIAV